MMMKKWGAVLTVIALLCSLIPGLADEEAAQMIEMELFCGDLTLTRSADEGQTILTSNAGGLFDPSLIGRGSYFTVEYTGTSACVSLAFSQWSTGAWGSVNYPKKTEKQPDGSFVSTFTYDQCRIKFGNDDMSGIDAIICGVTGNIKEPTTIRRVVWHGYPLPSDGHDDAETIFSGRVSAKARDTSLISVFTAHVGGSWNAARVAPGCMIRVEYEGPAGGVYLVLASASGATQWVKAAPTETGANDNGLRYIAYSYEALVRAFGDDFAHLDSLGVYSASATQTTLRRVVFYPGEIHDMPDAAAPWYRPDTGIAFIGDSIVQNALYFHGDWNRILGRSDCVNYGIGAQTTRECAARIADVASRNYTKLVILCGINDIGRGHSPRTVVANDAAMIETMRAQNPDCTYLIISVLPTTPAFYRGQQQKIVKLNEALAEYAESQADVTFVDCYSAFVGENSYCREELLGDGLHPNAAGYALIAEILGPYLD